jgi:hypothetical protein
MKEIELLRVGIVLVLISIGMMFMTSCTAVRETRKNIWTVDFQSPIKVNKLNKCEE